MSARTIALSEEGSIVVMRGWRIAQLARQAGLKPTYSGAAGGWMLDASRLTDLTAWLQYRNIRYELTTPTPPRAAQAEPPSAQVGLW